MIYPDEIPPYIGIPAIVICLLVLIGIKVAESREKTRRMLDEFERGGTHGSTAARREEDER